MKRERERKETKFGERLIYAGGGVLNPVRPEANMCRNKRVLSRHIHGAAIMYTLTPIVSKVIDPLVIGPQNCFFTKKDNQANLSLQKCQTGKIFPLLPCCWT